jgi:Tfp pilus assembly protein PilW
MKKRNQKGLTAIDLLITAVVCIVLHVVVSMFFKIHDNYETFINERVAKQKVTCEEVVK